MHARPIARWRSPRATFSWSLAALLCLVATPALAALPAGLSAGLSIQHDGEMRTYDVLVPAASIAESSPLVVDLHGFTSNSAQQRGISGWQAIAGVQDIVVVWPNGLNNSWNGGTCCGQSVADDVDDVGFIRALVATIQTETSIDAGRIYVTGLSNGGAMTQRLACEAADLFAAAAPMAFPAPYVDFPNECNTSESIPVLAFFGLNDVLVSYAGAAPTFAAWRGENGCDAAGAPPESSETFGGSDCQIDTTCGDPGVQVGLCSVTGTAFADPPLDAFSGHILYLNDDGFDISQRAWEFMSVYQRPVEAVPLGGAPLLIGGLLGGTGLLVGISRHRRTGREH